MNASLKKKIQKWRERIGYQEALKSLEVVGVSKSAAQKILAGTYEPEPKRLLLQAIELAMKP